MFKSMRQTLEKVNLKRGLLRLWLIVFFLMMAGLTVNLIGRLTDALQEVNRQSLFEWQGFVPSCLSAKVTERTTQALSSDYWRRCISLCKESFTDVRFMCEEHCRQQRYESVVNEVKNCNEWNLYSSCAVKNLFIESIREDFPFGGVLFWIVIFLSVYFFQRYKVLFYPIYAVASWIIRGFSREQSEKIGIVGAISNCSSDVPNKDVLCYAGWWRRFAAVFIDLFILVIPGYLITRILIMGFTARIDDEVSGIIGSYIIGLVVGVISNWLYFSLMESSPHQATWGKRALGIMVVDLQGERLSWARATGRHFSKFLSAIPFCLGYLFPLFTKRKQALHDLISGTLVIIK